MSMEIIVMVNSVRKDTLPSSQKKETEWGPQMLQFELMR